MTPSLSLHWWSMDFGKWLAALRNQRTMMQQALADVGCPVTMVRRCEAGETQTTLEVICNMARAVVAPAAKAAVKAAPAKRVAHAGGHR